MGNNDFAAATGMPVAIAIHSQHGRCTVLARLGQDFLIEVEHRYLDSVPNTDDLPLGVEPHEILFSETICTQMFVVPQASLEFRTTRR